MQHGATIMQDILLFSVRGLRILKIKTVQDLTLKQAAAVLFLATSLFCSLFFCRVDLCLWHEDVRIQVCYIVFNAK